MTDGREEVVRFLTSLAQASSALTLYERSHPAIERAIEVAYDHLVALQKIESRPVLTFLGEEVVFGALPVKSLSSWEWGRRLAEVGVQRFECHGPVTQEDFDGFVSKLFDRITGTATGDLVPDKSSSIRFGLVGVGSSDNSLSQIGSAVQGYALAEEIAALKWVDDEVRSGGKLHMAEVHTVVRSLAVAMHADVEMMIPLVELKGYDQYTTTHSMNISVLSMALGEFIGLSSGDVRRIGVAGLLHDIGKTKVPAELLNKGGKLSDEELAQIQRHPVEGARILLQREANLDLAAMVAYEHHIRFDGGGYPLRKYPRPCHPASDLVHLCDVYDALRTHRPYRKAWGQDRVLAYIDESLGSEFEPELGQAFLEMMRRWGSRLHRVTSKEDAVPIGQPDRPVEPEEPAKQPAAATPSVQKKRLAQGATAKRPPPTRPPTTTPPIKKAPAKAAAAKARTPAAPTRTSAPATGPAEVPTKPKTRVAPQPQAAPSAEQTRSQPKTSAPKPTAAKQPMPPATAVKPAAPKPAAPKLAAPKSVATPTAKAHNSKPTPTASEPKAAAVKPKSMPATQAQRPTGGTQSEGERTDQVEAKPAPKATPPKSQSAPAKPSPVKAEKVTRPPQSKPTATVPKPEPAQSRPASPNPPLPKTETPAPVTPIAKQPQPVTVEVAKPAPSTRPEPAASAQGPVKPSRAARRRKARKLAKQAKRKAQEDRAQEVTAQKVKRASKHSEKVKDVEPDESVRAAAVNQPVDAPPETVVAGPEGPDAGLLDLDEMAAFAAELADTESAVKRPKRQVSHAAGESD